MSHMSEEDFPSKVKSNWKIFCEKYPEKAELLRRSVAEMRVIPQGNGRDSFSLVGTKHKASQNLLLEVSTVSKAEWKMKAVKRKADNDGKKFSH